MTHLTAEDSPALTQLDIATLIVLAEKPMHGYGIAGQIIVDMGDDAGKVKPGTVYKVLNRLEECGYVQECDTKPGTASPFQRKVYELTIAGTSVLEVTCASQVNQANLGLLRLHRRLNFNRNANR